MPRSSRLSPSSWGLSWISQQEVEQANEEGILSPASHQHDRVVLEIYSIALRDNAKSEAITAIKKLLERAYPNLKRTSGETRPLPPPLFLGEVLSPSIADSNSTWAKGIRSETGTSAAEDSDITGLTDGKESAAGNIEEARCQAAGDNSVEALQRGMLISEQDDASDEEFTLEEELAGISEAPAKDRATLRTAMRREQDTRMIILQKTALEKRKTAEFESRCFKKIVSSPISIPMTDFARKTPRKPQPPEARQPPILRTARNSINTLQKDNQPQVQPLVIEDYEDEEDDSSSSGLISLASSSPKATDRFDSMLDPLRMDNRIADTSSDIPDSTNTYRTVMIENIPPEFTLHKLLAFVRGGTIVTARLIPETLSTSKGKMAVITFKTAREASNCCRLTSQTLKASKLDGYDYTIHSMHIYLLLSPTYPTREVAPIQQNVAGMVKMSDRTRCIAIDHFPRKLTNELCSEIRLNTRRSTSRIDALEEMWFEGETLHMQFATIKEAEKAYRVICFFHYGKFCKVAHYSPDPCALNSAGKLGEVIDVASSGFMGLKSLLETVGLAAYSRTQAKARGGKQTTYSGARTEDSPNRRQNRHAEVVVDKPTPSVTASRSGTAANPGSTPWTEELMRGLELL